ncbi:MAG TPA: hypothetical protein VFA04_13245 [Bryobacteraceae bacterium]|nr:hypothetical protein [Bryobacteraceae bacterium]
MPAASDAEVWQRMLRRVAWLAAGFGVAGAALCGWERGWRFAAGFLVGAALSAGSLWRSKKIADALGGETKPRSAIAWVGQLIILIGAAFAIIRYLKVTPVAVFLGLLVSAAAIISAILIELIWNTKSG